MALTKNNIVARPQEELGFTKSQSIQVTESLIEVIKASLESGDDVLVSGFGKFCVKEKMGRRGRNPATGEDMMLEPRRVVTFKCSGSFRKRVNGGWACSSSLIRKRQAPGQKTGSARSPSTALR
jgi:integration host factor subunit alpha